MTSYTVKFEGSTQERESAALRECVSYLGKARFNKVCAQIAKDLKGCTIREVYRNLRFALPFAGIQGYWPTRAMVKHIWPLV